MNKKMKIMFCIPALGSGGAERVVSVLSNKFIERGADVSILMISNMRCQYALDEAVNVKCINCDEDNHLSLIKRYLLRFKKIREATKEISPDIIISFMSETNIDVCLALLGMKIPIIVSERNDPAIDPKSRAKQILRKIAYIKPKGFVFQTPDAKAYFSNNVQKRSCIILNPINSQLPDAYKGEREKRVVSVGRLHRQKNFKMLFDAFSIFSKENSEYTLEIYGEGLLEAELNNYLKDKNMEEKVFLKGFCDDVHSKILSASMFVMSSDFEGLPNALLEAMAIGLPSISTDCPCGGPRLLIENKKNGILVPVGDTEKMAAAMDYIAKNPKEAEKIATFATQINERANVEKIATLWLDFAEKCLEK